MTNYFDGQEINIRVKFALVWVSTMFCFIYADYFELYIPGKLEEVSLGLLGPLGAINQIKLIATAMMMIIPSIMITLSIITKPSLCRLLNIIIPSLYIALTIMAILGSWYFYMLFGLIEIFLLSIIIRWAIQWPMITSNQFH